MSLKKCFLTVSIYFPFVQNGDLVGKMLGFLQILCGQEYGRAVIGKFFHSLPNLDARLGVKPGGRRRRSG